MAMAETIQKPESDKTRSEKTRVQRTSPSRYLPDVDIFENPEEFALVADVPGAGAKDVEVQYENGQLAIRARVPDRQGAEQRNYLLREYGIGDYERTFQVKEEVNCNAIVAEIKHGVLTVRLPKAESVKPKKIEVKAEI